MSCDLVCVMCIYMVCWYVGCVVLVGYLFGVDVMLFVYNWLLVDLCDKVVVVLLFGFVLLVDF